MTQSQKAKQITTYLIYGAIALLILNFILLFLPFMKVYQPSRRVTVLGTTTYEGWYTSYALMAMFIFPIVTTGIPYLCSIIGFFVSLKKENSKNGFLKLKNDRVNKPVKFFWLKFGAVVNLIAMVGIYSGAVDNVSYLAEHGAYCRLTFLGILSIICTIVLLILLSMLSRKSKRAAFKAKLALEIATEQANEEK